MSDIETLIKKSLENYYFRNNKFKKVISYFNKIGFEKAPQVMPKKIDEVVVADIGKSKIKSDKYTDNALKNLESNKIQLVKKVDDYFFSYEILGVFSKKVFCWSWSHTFLPKELSRESKYLLEYGLQIEPSSMNDLSLLKVILTNSRLKINNNEQLEIILSLILYLLGDRVDFIFKNKILDDEGSFQILVIKRYLSKI
tara:strand:+ start:1404 stop:1997 length:594 start_codon:yes stop_codon:yes gene_type:complete